MIKNIKNIFKLSKIFFQNSFQNPYIINKKTNKINWKSPFVWLIIILMITISLISINVIPYLIKINMEKIFLQIFFLILSIIMVFQVILASTNVYFFSKDFELVLPLPIKTENLLMSKFMTILFNLYFSEFIFVLFPLLIFGIFADLGLLYFIYLILILLIFPILFNLIISTIMMLLMKLSKFIKNKDVFQVIITFIFLIIIFIAEFEIATNIIEKIDNNLGDDQLINLISNFNNKLEVINNYFLIINPTINILENCKTLIAVINIFKVIFINLIFFIIFIFIGKKYYLKNILKNNNYYLKKINKKIFKKRSRKLNIKKAYIKKEFKILFKNPTFFMQCIFPNLILIVSLIIIVFLAAPNIQCLLLSDIFLEQNIEFSVDLSTICIVLGLIQIIFILSNISASSISREGNNAIYMKFLPIDYYKQFIYKSIPQILLNNFLILIILILIKIIFSTFDIVYLIFIFLIANLLNIINSEIMVLIDLLRPNLKWHSYYEAIKNNNNKLFQYGLTIIIVLFIKYLYEVLKNINLFKANVIIIIILLIIILIINKIIKNNIKRLYKNIN